MNNWLTADYEKYLKKSKKKNTPELFERFLSKKLIKTPVKDVFSQLFWESHCLHLAVLNLAKAITFLDKQNERSK